jgi:hypothetical protein
MVAGKAMNLRLSEDVLGRIEAYRVRLAAETHLEVNTSDATRSLIMLGLEVAAVKQAKPKK